MVKNSGIFIFTRDRSDVLLQTIQGVRESEHRIILIDDSVTEMSRRENREIIENSKGLYFGKQEFRNFINRYGIDVTKFSFLLRQLGDERWNLGYTRNLALLIGKTCKFENVLFMDDDISVSSLALIDDLFSLLKKHHFTGAHIQGLIDDSVLGHIATDLNIFNERMLSGGFMAFQPRNAEHYFLNNYNEDWIWLYLHLKDKTHFQTGTVIQALYDPLSGYKKKIFFQEYGEIVLDGIIECYKEGPKKNLCSILFWDRIIKERADYLETMSRAALLNNRVQYLDIIEEAKEHSGMFTAAMFHDLFEKYYHNLDLFKSLYQSL